MLRRGLVLASAGGLLFPSAAFPRVPRAPFAGPSDTTSATPVGTGGTFLVPEVPTGTTIKVLCQATDWAGMAAPLSFAAADVNGPTKFTLDLAVYHPDDVTADELLDVRIQVTDNTPVAGDNVVLMFDNSHDGVVASTASYVASDDRGIRFSRNKTVELVFGSSVSPSVKPSGSLAMTPCIDGGGTSGAVGGATWKVEAKLRPSDLGLNNFNAVVGASVVARDLSAAMPGVWPSVANANPGTWANVILRQPVDYVLVVDQSGSMAGANKWPSLKQAADNFALVLSKTTDPSLDALYPMVTKVTGVGGLGDRLGMANFTSALPPPPPYPPLLPGWSSVVNGFAAPGGPGSFSAGLPPSPFGGTPIAAGLNRAFEMFGGAPTFGGLLRSRVVMLLSDGMHNTPNPAINLTTLGIPDLMYLPSPACGDNSLVLVNTVAIGTDATVATATLDALKNCYRKGSLGGGKPGHVYNIVDPAGSPDLTAELTRFFVETIEPFFQWNTINSTGANFTINAGDRRLLLFAFWSTKSAAVNLTITNPGGTVLTGSSDNTLGYSWLVLTNPPSGSYTNFTAAGAAAKFVMVDLGVRGDFAIDNRAHGTGGTILLRARLRERGLPVLGADVRTDIARPAEGFGTYASTHSLVSCAALAPRLPPLPQGDRPIPSRPDSMAAPDSTGDVKPPAFALVSALFQRCGKTALDRHAESGRQLFDDGSHGDMTAGDGIYTLAMDNTEFEGSYVFQFRATGHTSNGESFSRIHESAAYVGVDADAGASPVGSRVLQVAGNMVTQEFYVLPRDRRLEYLGPGHVDRVAFRVRGSGMPVGPVVDYNNGYYGQVLRYDRTHRAPIVTPVVNGKPLTPINPSQRPWELVVPYAGATLLDNALGLDDGVVLGARAARRLSGPLWAEVEGGATFAKAAGNSGHIIQLLGNLRYDLGTGKWVPYVTAGAGYALFRGFGANDEAFLYQGGVGATLHVSPRFGLRADARVLRIGSVLGAGSSTNVQVTAGLVWWF
jgi:hypothetical protein